MKEILNIFYITYGDKIRQHAKETKQDFTKLFTTAFYKFMSITDDKNKELVLTAMNELIL